MVGGKEGVKALQRVVEVDAGDVRATNVAARWGKESGSQGSGGRDVIALSIIRRAHEQSTGLDLRAAASTPPPPGLRSHYWRARRHDFTGGARHLDDVHVEDWGTAATLCKLWK